MKKRYILTGSQAKYVDDHTQLNGVSGEILMDRAAGRMCDYIIAHFPVQAKILCIAGPGNNGGDVLVLAKKLKEYNYNVDVSRVSRDIACDCSHFSDYDLIVEGMFGIGLNRNIIGNFVEAIESINKLDRKHTKVIACDIPSGIHATTGLVMDYAVKADVTITFGYSKLGMMLYPGKEYCGEVILEDIGFNEKAFDDLEMVGFTGSHGLPIRSNASNKGSYGKVLVMAGSDSMPGAAILASKASLRFGAGYVTLHSVSSVLDKCVIAVPEIIIKKAFENDEFIMPEIAKADACIIGPGLGKGLEAKTRVKAVLEAIKLSDFDKALIVDADAINIISDMMNCDEIITPEKRVEWLSDILPDKTIFTPHKKELSRLLNIPMDEMQSLSQVLPLISGTKQIFVLKDAVTLVVSKDYMYINDSGNNGMSTPGMGDVLTGAIAAFIAQKMPLLDAVSSAVYYHGLAGDISRDEYSEYGVIASDICDNAAKALRKSQMVTSNYEPCDI